MVFENKEDYPFLDETIEHINARALGCVVFWFSLVVMIGVVIYLIKELL